MKRLVLAAAWLALLLAAAPAHAQQARVLPGPCPPTATNINGSASPFWVDSAGNLCTSGVGADSVSKHLVSSLLTKITGAGTYTSASTTAPQAICLFASVTACAPLTMTVSAGTATVNGNITGIMLVKSTTGATAATFRVLVYQAAPTLTAVFNTTVYTPLIADLASGAYVGSWECSTQVANADSGYFDCSANRPSGNNAFNLSDGTLRFVIVATGAYVSGSSETFRVIADVLASAP